MYSYIDVWIYLKSHPWNILFHKSLQYRLWKYFLSQNLNRFTPMKYLEQEVTSFAFPEANGKDEDKLSCSFLFILIDGIVLLLNIVEQIYQLTVNHLFKDLLKWIIRMSLMAQCYYNGCYLIWFCVYANSVLKIIKPCKNGGKHCCLRGLTHLYAVKSSSNL